MGRAALAHPTARPSSDDRREPVPVLSELSGRSAKLSRIASEPLESTMGALGDVKVRDSSSETSHAARTSSREPNIKAKGLSGRSFGPRSRATAVELVASTRSWNPPKPFNARTRPFSSAWPPAGVNYPLPRAVAPSRPIIRLPARSLDMRSAGHENGGRPDRGTRLRIPGTWEIRPSQSAADRRAGFEGSTTAVRSSCNSNG